MSFLKNIFDLKRANIGIKSMVLFFLLVSMKPIPEEGNEYSIKAMFIYNFTKYIDWSQSSAAKTFRIGVVGKSELFEALESIASQKKIDNKSIEVKKLSDDDNSVYQVIFVAKSEIQRIEELSKKYSGKGVLIISEECRHSERCATINLITTNNKVKFEINQASARIAGLKISSVLTNLAESVNP